MIKISELTEATPSVLESINQLLPQLSSKASSLTMDQLLELTSSDSTLVFLCSNAADEITGTAYIQKL